MLILKNIIKELPRIKTLNFNFSKINLEEFISKISDQIPHEAITKNEIE
jgi:hypothetical protein